MSVRSAVLAVLAAALVLPSPAGAQVCNVKVLTDATPDYYDLKSMVRSITSRWPTPEEKCWAMFYWNHIARRQTSPMMLHGLELTDPIRQFNDYGYTMCSTIAGVNCSIWDAMGLEVKYWDIALHTVSEVSYGGRWHVYDNSMSALYTLCDGRSIAGVEDVGRPGACAASGGKTERGHVARYHCLTANGVKSFLTGADCARSLDEESHCFNPNALKYRYYFFDWDRGHRYVLNLKQGESYTRYYHSLGKEPKFYVPNHGKDPDQVVDGRSRFRLRGNGVWTFRPPLTAAAISGVVHSMKNMDAVEPQGLQAIDGLYGDVVFKIDGANAITAMTIKGTMEAVWSCIYISTTNGMSWKEVWNDLKGQVEVTPVKVDLAGEVNGAYEVLVKFGLASKPLSSIARLRDVEIQTTTQLNAKTQPRLNLGSNTVYVGRGAPTESIVLWPDLRGDNAKPLIVESRNVATQKEHPGYMGAMHAAKAKEEAFVVFRIDAPRPITRLVYGGRLYNRAPKSHIDFLHSFDGGKTWSKSYSLTETKPPWDVIRYETVEAIPPGTKSALVKYAWSSSEAGPSACSLYALRMEADYPPADPAFKPLEVTFRWNEVQEDRSLVPRSHTELVTRVPHRYTLNVGGSNHPAMDSLRVNLQGAVQRVKHGYSDGRDAGGPKHVPRRVTRGRNIALGKPYTVSIPSGEHWGSGDPQGKKLTDGVVGPPYAGGIAASYGLCWTEGKEPVVTVDLGSRRRCGAFSIHLTGYPFWDALKGEVKDQIELLTSADGTTYTSHGRFNLELRWKDLPANLMWPDEETMTGPVFDLAPPEPVEARYVRYRIAARRFTMTSEVEVLDALRSEPFDLRLALPDE